MFFGFTKRLKWQPAMLRLLMLRMFSVLYSLRRLSLRDRVDRYK